jgi:hypothetical protein
VFYQFTNPTRGTLTFTAPSPGNKLTGCQTTPGEFPPGKEIKAPEGNLSFNDNCIGFTEHSDFFCHSGVVHVWAYDLNVDYETPVLDVDPRC